MNSKSHEQPTTHWSQLLTLFLVPGALQGIAFYFVMDGMHDVFMSWRLFVIWFLVVAPTCMFLITVPRDRWRSLLAGVLLAWVLSGLFYMDARDALGASEEQTATGFFVVLCMLCSVVIVCIALPFYRTRWQKGLPFSHYPSLFEFAWNQTVCVLVGLLFTGLVAALMGLTVGLFNALGISLGEWLFDSAFIGAWLGGSFAVAIGVTRQSDAVVSGTRVLLLALLRILLPLMLPIFVIFVAMVGIVGVARIDTGLSIALLMVAAAITAITLISARIGDADELLTGFQQLLTRSMAVVVLPLSLLAAHALTFRVEQYGWTSTRIVAAVIVMLCVFYGAAYLLAAVRSPRVWIPVINRWMAILCATVALLMMTPMMDPDRLSVHDQMSRFYDGRTTAEQLDLGYLKFQSGRAGREALAALSLRPESQKPPLDTRLADLAGFSDRYNYQYENATMGKLRFTGDIVDTGTFRLLEEHSSGWVRLNALSELTSRELLSLGQFDIRNYCQEAMRDCALLSSSAEADLLAIRVSDTQMMFYLLPIAKIPNQPPEEVDTDELMRGLKEGELPPDPFPTFPQRPVQFGAGFTAPEIDAWFASLDQGQVPAEIVQVPSFVIGATRILRSGSLLTPLE